MIGVLFLLLALPAASFGQLPVPVPTAAPGAPPSEAAAPPVSEVTTAVDDAASPARDALPAEAPPADPAPAEPTAAPAAPADDNDEPRTEPAVGAVADTVDRATAEVPAPPVDPTPPAADTERSLQTVADAPTDDTPAGDSLAGNVTDSLQQVTDSRQVTDSVQQVTDTVQQVTDSVPATDPLPVDRVVEQVDEQVAATTEAVDEAAAPLERTVAPVVEDTLATVDGTLDRAETAVPVLGTAPETAVGSVVDTATDEVESTLAALPAIDPTDPATVLAPAQGAVERTVNDTLAPVVETLAPPSDPSGGLLSPLAPVVAPTALVERTIAEHLPPASGATPSAPPAPPVQLASPAPATSNAGLLDSALRPDEPARGLQALAGTAGQGDTQAPLAGALPGLAAGTTLAHGANPAAALTPAVDGGGSLPGAPGPATAAGASAAAGSGVAFTLLFALLFSVAAFALQHYSRLRLPPAQWRFFRFVAVVERPG